MGYLAAVLQQQGYTVEMLEIRDGPEAIAARLVGREPLVVGFSLIFQYLPSAVPAPGELSARSRNSPATLPLVVITRVCATTNYSLIFPN